jgi:hypothetical protein
MLGGDFAFGGALGRRDMMNRLGDFGYRDVFLQKDNGHPNSLDRQKRPSNGHHPDRRR